MSKVILDISVASDQNYFEGMLMTAASMAQYASAKYQLRFNVLDGGISEASYAFLVETVRRFKPDALFNRIEVNGEQFANLTIWHGSRMAYARLMLPVLLPEVDHIIYSDVDTLWCIDISRLWELRDDKVILKGALDGMDICDMLNQEREFCRRNNLPFNKDKYINSGSILMNLKMMREESFHLKALEFLEKHPDSPCVDQSMFCALLMDRIGVVSQEWNMRIPDFATHPLSFLKNGFVIHYAGGEQPWKPLRSWKSVFDDQRCLWYRMYANVHQCGFIRAIKLCSGVGDYILRRLGFHLVSFPVTKVILRCLYCHYDFYYGNHNMRLVKIVNRFEHT